MVISVNYGFGGGVITNAKSSAESEKFTLKIRSESGKLFTNGCHFPPKSANFGTLQKKNEEKGPGFIKYPQTHIFTGWSINNRTILNCSHFLDRRYSSNPFSPKWSMHTGKLSQQHEFVMASFVILVWCHFVSPYNMGGSANSVLCRGRHFWKIARVNAN